MKFRRLKNERDVFSSSALIGFGKSSGAADEADCPRNARQGLQFVPGLDRLHLVDIGGVEQLGSVEHEDEIRFRLNHRHDAVRFGALPSRPRQQERAAIVPGCATAYVSEIERVLIDELQRKAPALSIAGTVRANLTAGIRFEEAGAD